MDFLIVLLMLAVYLLPALVALGRGHHQAWAITALDVLLGWTLLGWVAALVWSLTSIPPGRAMS